MLQVQKQVKAIGSPGDNTIPSAHHDDDLDATSVHTDEIC